MRANISPYQPFKYFDNDLTLFQIIKYHFPYGDHIDSIQVHQKDCLNNLFIAAEKERLGKLYPSLSTWENYRQMGFVSRISGHDWSLNKLQTEFIIWADKDGWISNFKLIKELNQLPPNYGPDDVDKFLETTFFKTFGYGFNDALYLEELNNLNLEAGKVPVLKNLQKHSSNADEEKRLLVNIWKTDEDHYKKVIAYLTNENEYVNKPLLKENRWIGKLTHLRGFINVCKNKCFLNTDELQIAQLEKIINNTFNTNLEKSDAFKGFFNKEKPAVINGEKKAIENPWESPFSDIPLP